MDYSMHHSRGSGSYEQRTSYWRRLLLLMVLLLLGAGAGFLYYQYKKNPAWAETLTMYHEHISAWLLERKKNMRMGMAAVSSQFTDRDDSERVVNFEFYNTLQDMESMQVEAEAEAQKKIEADEALKAALAKRKEKVTAKNVKKVKLVKINRAAELEKDLLAVMKQTGGGK